MVSVMLCGVGCGSVVSLLVSVSSVGWVFRMVVWVMGIVVLCVWCRCLVFLMVSCSECVNLFWCLSSWWVCSVSLVWVFGFVSVVSVVFSFGCCYVMCRCSSGGVSESDGDGVVVFMVFILFLSV